MSLFGSLMGDLEDDPFFGSHVRSMRQMNSMMNSFFTDPFGMMDQPAAITAGPNHARRAGGAVARNDMQMMPFGFPPMPGFNMGRIFTDFENMAANGGNCHSFTSSSVMTMGNGPDGRPQVYQESMSTRTAPGGVKETKKTVCDSRTGTKKMAIGHHIGDRAHILEREQNIHNGDEEEHQEFINLDEDEAETFNREWEQRARRQVAAIGNGNYGARNSHHHNRRPEHRQLALPPASSPTASSRQSSHSRWVPPSPRRSIRSVHNPKTNGSSNLSRSTSSGTKESTDVSVPKISPQDAKINSKKETASTVTINEETNRKREHSPEDGERGGKKRPVNTPTTSDD